MLARVCLARAYTRTIGGFVTVSFIANRKRAAIAALASLVAVLALTAYVSAPSWPDASLAAEYASASGRTLVTGVVKTSSGRPIRSARVRLVFSGRRVDSVQAAGRLVVTTRVNRRGRFATVVPKGATRVRVTIATRSGSTTRTASDTFKIRRGAALKITAVFPPRRAGVLPGLFPY
jgi:hypothetical protein